jgi:transcriptional regulator with XRE-family HTH domain
MEFDNEQFVHYKDSKGLTYDEIAKRLDVSRQAVMLWAQAPHKPRPNRVRALCKILEIEVVDISDLQPDQETIDKFKNLDKPTDCEKICLGLQDDGKEMMKRYKQLDYPAREVINTTVKTEWEKKHSGATADSIPLDHDKHAAS